MTDLYSLKDCARIFGLAESRLRYWMQTGFTGPSVRKNGRFYYTFQDLVGVKTAKELLDAGLTVQRVRKNLESLRTSLPDDATPAARLRICSDGETIVAIADDVVFEPGSGQVVMSFALDRLGDHVAEILALPRPAEPAASSDKSDKISSTVKRAGPTRASTPAVANANGLDDDHLAAPEPIVDDPTDLMEAPSGYRAFLEGCASEERGDLAGAEAAYRRALVLQPTLAAAHTNVGNLAYRRGDVAGARVAYEQAIDCEPGQPEARYNLANLLEDVGETELAIAELRRVCHASPDFADAHYNLGILLARVGGTAQAQRHLERYLEIDAGSDWAERAKSFLATLAA